MEAVEADAPAEASVVVDLQAVNQAVEGFGTCFNELGWTSLSELSEADRAAILEDLFTPAGMNLSMARMPVGANDFSVDFYSYDDVSGDLALEHFSIDRDRQRLIPFIRAAKAVNPSLRIWASPWCPPEWMKVNRHYASRTAPFNGLQKERETPEGTDAFILEPAYLQAYAQYFGKFIDAYKAEGIDIFMVMPQNEPNSDQVFPSCTWTPEGLVAFLKYLEPEMASRHGTGRSRALGPHPDRSGGGTVHQGHGLPMGRKGRPAGTASAASLPSVLPDGTGVWRRPEQLARRDA